MDIADVLAADLRDLAGDLAEDSVTRSSLTVLRRDLKVAVRSVLGFSLTMTVPGPVGSVAVNVFDEPLEPGVAADALAVQLPRRGHGDTASLTIYAGTPDALDGLRQDLATALGVASESLLDPLGPRTVIAPGLSGLADFSDAHRAVGVLMGAGHTYDAACVELVRQAHHHPGGIVGAARSVLSDAQDLAS